MEKRSQYKLEKDYNAKELQFLEEAYEVIQSGLKDIDKEKNEVISKAHMENKVRLLAKRKEIIDQVFAMTKEKIEEYRLSDEYVAKLKEKIKSHMEFLGDGDYIIYLDYREKDRFHEFAKEFPQAKVFFEKKYIEMLGGCKLHNTTTNVYLDDSYAKRLEEEEENFLQYCGIDIEDKVGD